MSSTSPDTHINLHSDNVPKSEETLTPADFEAAVPPVAALPVTVRFFQNEDKNFILHSWMVSFRQENYAQTVCNEVYYFNHQRVIGKIAETADIFVACSVDDPNQIWGWLCAQQGPEGSLLVHYVYVKSRYRRFGVAKLLLSAAGYIPGAKVWGTHWSEKADKIGSKFNAKFNPYLLMRGI